MDFLKELITVSEKAANIARLCRQNEHLFTLLIQKKSDSEANPRFVEDFKTLADVLIQQLVKHDITKKFPDLADSIRGEENNIFCNKLGETIAVEIKATKEETAALLRVVLNDDDEAAGLLAEEVHREVQLECVNTEIPDEDFCVCFTNLGIWIDPIDSTAEYINGIEEIAANGISISGLKCVTVLIGVYDKNTTLPVIGVVNQPFIDFEQNQWRGQCFWASPIQTNLPPCTPPTQTICVSSSEDTNITDKLSTSYNITNASGAGYKILTVITGQADAYILSKDSTFKWDTCGPQAILRALGGDIVTYESAMAGQMSSLKYPETENCNKGGIVAYRNSEVLKDLMKKLA